MSWTAAARIRIGGNLPRDLLDKFLKAAKNARAGVVGNQEYVGVDWVLTKKKLNAILKKHTYVALYNDTASYGEFFELEEFCRNNGLSYDRHNHRGDEAPASWDYYRPERGRDPYYMPADDDGSPLCDADIVLTAYRELLAGNVHEAISALDDALGHFQQVPELPLFKIV